MNGKKNTKAYLSLTLAMVIYGSIGVFRRYIPYSSALLSCVRGLVAALCLMLYVKLKRGKVFCKLSKKQIGMLLITGAFIGGNWIFLFESLKYTTVAVATLCYYMEPTIVILATPLFFNDKLTKKKVICAIVAFMGMFLVAGMSTGKEIDISDVKGIAFGLIAAIMYSSVVILSKKIDVEDVYTRTIIQLLAGAIFIMPYLFCTEKFRFIELDGFSLLMVAIVCVVHTAFAYVLHFDSITKLKPQTVAFFSYIDPISALILADIILGEKMSMYSIVGAMMIIGSAIVLELKPKQKEICNN